MIHFIEGRSGTGKTKYVTELLGNLAKQGNRKLMYLMPEQSSFGSETNFLHMIGPKLSRYIRVMSFTRLYDMVMYETGMISGTPIDDGVRRVLMSMALEDCAEQLSVYKKQALKPQFTELMLSAVKEFKTCGISTEDLRNIASQTEGTELSEKLSEISLITDVYNAHIAQSYIDPLDNGLRLEKRLAESDFFKGYTVAVDDFSGFTAQEQKILNLIMQQSEDVYITLCKDCDKEDELFFTVNRTKKRILRNAAAMGLRTASPVRLRENHRMQSEELYKLESSLYRLSKPEKTENEPILKDIKIAEARDIFEECEYIAEQINGLALNGKCRYNEIAVICRDSMEYRGILDAAFESHNIPYFMSKPEAVDNKPLMLMVLSALEYVLTPNDSEKLFSIAKSGLAGLNEYETAILENYAYTWNLKGRQFAKPFELNPDGYTDRISDDLEERLEELNGIREKLIAPLINFSEKLDGADAKQISAALYELLIEYNVPEQLDEELSSGILEEFSSEEVRLWNLLMDILNKMVLALGGRRVTVKRYYELLKMMICTHELSEIPRTLDQVTVGTADSIRLDSPYAVFIIGAVKGKFPHDPVSSGMFNDNERRRLITMELPVYDAAAELFLQEKFFVYNAVSAPRKKLAVTYPTANYQGEELYSSSIVSEIFKTFPNVQKEIISAIPVIERIQSEKSAFAYCAERYSKNDALSKALKEYFEKKPEYSGRISAIKKTVERKPFKINNKNLSAAIFGSDKRLSSSQIEKFYMCRFQYFCQYGLKLKERRKAEIGTLEFGNLVHFLLENVLAEYREKNYEWLSDEELSKLLDTLLEQYMEEVMGGKDEKTDRVLYSYYRMKGSIERLMQHLKEELSQSEFRPVDFELKIGSQEGIKAYCVKDSHGNNVEIIGSVDRVDLMKTEQNDYVRIIDYKTGQKKFKLSDVLYGINMQMLIYLSAICQNGSKRYGDKISPAGILYMPSDYKSVTVDPSASDQDVKSEHDKKLKMNGLILNESHVMHGMEEPVDGNFKYLPLAFTKKGDISKKCKDALISNTQLNIIFDKVAEQIKKMSELLDDGSIESIPIEGAYNSCEWCIFGDICGYREGDEKREVKSFDNEEVFEQINREKTGEGE